MLLRWVHLALRFLHLTASPNRGAAPGRLRAAAGDTQTQLEQLEHRLREQSNALMEREITDARAE
jgi:hypothetical protein